MFWNLNNSVGAITLKSINQLTALATSIKHSFKLGHQQFGMRSLTTKGQHKKCHYLTNYMGFKTNFCCHELSTEIFNKIAFLVLIHFRNQDKGISLLLSPSHSLLSCIHDQIRRLRIRLPFLKKKGGARIQRRYNH